MGPLPLLGLYQPAGRRIMLNETGLNAIEELIAAHGLEKPLSAVSGTRTVKKSDMVLNSATPKIDVDPETYVVRADGELLVCEAAVSLPLTQRYFLF